ncbi:MAG: hypothetical protein GY854_13995 [Deltaproteobacteria bacterium]|nr:hypothetical protein [Deltaproteobacteria bacterium]
MPVIDHCKRHRRRQQEGVVMLLVMLLVLMFTGLGLMAMRHTRGELKSAGAYLDGVQGASFAEMPILMAVTDMRLNWSRTCADDENYITQFRSNVASGNLDDMVVRFSPAFFIDDVNDPPEPSTSCSGADGGVPGLNGIPLAETPILSNMLVSASLSHSVPLEMPPPSGFSFKEQNQTYTWYSFRIRSTYEYGAATRPTESSYYTWAQTTARAMVYMGPMWDYLQTY